MPETYIALIFAAVVVCMVAIMYTRATRRPSADPGFASAPDPGEQRPLAAVVFNPTRFGDVATVHVQIAQVCAELGWSDPLWLETSAEDPGIGQARTALTAGADLVLVCGGDGTIRNVAQVLAGSGTAMGLLPAGTGNLLARNLAIQLDDPAAATRIALSGVNRPIDVGRVSVDDGDEEQVFLVMAGMGFDAAIMAGAPARLKARVGPLAYFISGTRALKGPQVRIALTMDGQPEMHRRVRTVVVGNCGRLLAGLVLMPAAKLDDGLLDVVTIAPKGIIGWLAVAAQVLTRRRSGHPIIEHRQGHTITIASEGPQQVQFDGDSVGNAQILRMRVERGALLVRVAR
ncbi:MAG: diacylglycerol/lipid kinase family protein [Pseudonocardiaceae bacterium]